MNIGIKVHSGIIVEKEMATHSVFLPGKSQGWEPGGLPSLGTHRVGQDWSDLAAAAAAGVILVRA